MSAPEGEATRKRLKMRSWRRGTKEMDMILGPYADERLAGMDEAALEQFEALLDENDQDLYQWVTGQGTVPEPIALLLADIAEHARDRLRG